METVWYYAEAGNIAGPASKEEVVRRIGQFNSRPHLVWKAGMSEWADPSSLTDFSNDVQPTGAAPADDGRIGQVAKSGSAGGAAALGRRARNEFIEYLLISAYLYVCFGSVLLYKATILKGAGIEYAAFGIAIVKALILGKFLLMLHALRIGERGAGGSTVLANILKKSVLFALLLIVMTVIEEMIVGYFHGRPIREVLHELAGGTLPSAFATAELLLLILIPYFGFREIGASLGDGGLARLLTERRSADRNRM